MCTSLVSVCVIYGTIKPPNIRIMINMPKFIIIDLLIVWGDGFSHY